MSKSSKLLEFVVSCNDLGTTAHSNLVMSNMLSNVKSHVQSENEDWVVKIVVADVRADKVLEVKNRKLIPADVGVSKESYINSKLKNRSSDHIIIDLVRASGTASITNKNNNSYAMDIYEVITGYEADNINKILRS